MCPTVTNKTVIGLRLIGNPGKIEVLSSNRKVGGLRLISSSKACHSSHGNKYTADGIALAHNSKRWVPCGDMDCKLSFLTQPKLGATATCGQLPGNAYTKVTSRYSAYGRPS